MSHKEHARLFPKKADNKEPVVLTIGTDVTLNFVDSGTDTVNTLYYGFGNNGAYEISIRPSATVLITTINGKVLTDPMTVSTAGYTDKFIELRSMIVKTTTASTSLKVFAKGG